MNEKFDEIGPRCFLYEPDTVRSREIGKALKESYIPFDTFDIRSFTGLSQLFGDALIGYSTHKFAHLAANFTDVYYYKFSYVGRSSLFYYPRDKPYGVHHGDDLQYIYNPGFFGPMIQTNDPENLLVDRMTRIIEHFAGTG